MARRTLTVNEQIRKLNEQQQAIYNKLRRLAPAGTVDFTPTEDGTLLAWQFAWKYVSGAAAGMEDLAQDSIVDDWVQAEKGLGAKAPEDFCEKRLSQEKLLKR